MRTYVRSWQYTTHYYDDVPRNRRLSYRIERRSRRWAKVKQRRRAS